MKLSDVGIDLFNKSHFDGFEDLSKEIYFFSDQKNAMIDTVLMLFEDKLNENDLQSLKKSLGRSWDSGFRYGFSNIYNSFLDMKVIKDSYNDYISVPDESKEVMARHIARTASGHIKNKGTKLEDWLEVFKDEEIVISKLKSI